MFGLYFDLICVVMCPGCFDLICVVYVFGLRFDLIGWFTLTYFRVVSVRAVLLSNCVALCSGCSLT